MIEDAGGGGSGGYVPADEDCDEMADEVEPDACDTGLDIANVVGSDGAKAIELCNVAVGEKDWGIVSANYVRADGATAAPGQQVGLLDNFGPNNLPRAGAKVLVLSSGRARLPGQAGACNTATCTGTGAGTAPAGFPQTAPGCEIGDVINDDIGLEVALRAPTNATGYSFDFKFYSFEYAEWVCSEFNDQFRCARAKIGTLDLARHFMICLVS